MASCRAIRSEPWPAAGTLRTDTWENLSTRSRFVVGLGNLSEGESALRRCSSGRGCSDRGFRVRCLGGAVVVGVDALGFFELVLKDDDAAGRLDGSALVDEFPGSGSDA